MKIPRNISAAQLVNSLKKIGYSITRQRGSHIRLSIELDQKIHHITIPNHNPIKIGTLNNILNDLSAFHKIDKSKLISKLFE
ncbi:MAG: type II toxin-antitoxin system HicA family toxin [Calditrichaeota bacterium]|nr:type II toxin-antitoxin system HicA family toxin [Calditrichota bacterium]